MRVGLLPSGQRIWIAGTYYVRNLVEALRRLPAERGVDPVLIAQASASVDTALWSSGVETIRYSLHGSRRRLHLLAAAATRRILGTPPAAFDETLAKERVDVIFPVQEVWPTWLPAAQIAWVWDLQHRHLPEYFSPEELALRDRLFAGLAQHADAVVVSSEVGRRDFLAHYTVDPGRVHALRFRAALPPAASLPDAAEVLGKHGIGNRFVLLPNQFWAHKNHAVAFEAVRLLKERGVDLNLVCTGNPADYRRPELFVSLVDGLLQADIGPRVRLLGLVRRLEQLQLMRRAVAVLQPSLFEGWSTIVEEARALGKRIVLSDIPVHREQDPPRATYFDPRSPADLADALATAWSEPEEDPGQVEALAASSQADLLVRYGQDFVEIAERAMAAYRRRPAPRSRGWLLRV